jgi:hypothetical protein
MTTVFRKCYIHKRYHMRVCVREIMLRCATQSSTIVLPEPLVTLIILVNYRDASSYRRTIPLTRVPSNRRFL